MTDAGHSHILKSFMIEGDQDIASDSMFYKMVHQFKHCADKGRNLANHVSPPHIVQAQCWKGMIRQRPRPTAVQKQLVKPL